MSRWKQNFRSLSSPDQHLGHFILWEQTYLHTLDYFQVSSLEARGLLRLPLLGSALGLGQTRLPWDAGRGGPVDEVGDASSLGSSRQVICSGLVSSNRKRFAWMNR